jgi:cyanate permease
MTVTSLRRTGGPFFFDANEFMISNVIGLLAFAGLVAAALALRRRTDWHRRLMLSALAAITGPGFGRLLPMPLMVPWAWEICSALGVAFILAGMIRDQRNSGAIHPAWLVGLIAGLGWIALGEWLAYTDWGIELTRQVLAGHPGAARPMEAYIPAGLP